jgi:BlaI family transcriptional regulator, penicillinase repressor
MYEVATMPKRKRPTLSSAETQILSIVWSLERATVREVCEALPPQRKITYATVQTLLRRLEKKGYLKHQQKGLAHVFYSSVKQQDVVRGSVKDFIDRLFGGDPAPLLLHLAETGEVSTEDLERLRKVIEENEESSGG